MAIASLIALLAAGACAHRVRDRRIDGRSSATGSVHAGLALIDELLRTLPVDGQIDVLVERRASARRPIDCSAG